MTTKTTMPREVRLSDARRHLQAATPTRLYLGNGTNDEPKYLDLEVDSPHIMISAGSGRGKSVNVKTLVAQHLRHGGHVIVLDIKQHSHRYLRGLANVRYASTVEEIHEALIWLRAEVDRRNAVVKSHEYTISEADIDVGPRILVVGEELNSTMPELVAHWQEIRLREDPTLSPAKRAWGILAYQGRAVRVHVVSVAQAATAGAMGGTEVRSNFAYRFLAGYGKADQGMWKILAGGAPYIRPSKIRGRWAVALDGASFAVQGLFLTDDEARDWATGTIEAEPAPESPATPEIEPANDDDEAGEAAPLKRPTLADQVLVDRLPGDEAPRVMTWQAAQDLIDRMRDVYARPIRETFEDAETGEPFTVETPNEVGEERIAAIRTRNIVAVDVLHNGTPVWLIETISDAAATAAYGIGVIEWETGIAFDLPKGRRVRSEARLTTFKRGSIAGEKTKPATVILEGTARVESRHKSAQVKLTGDIVDDQASDTVIVTVVRHKGVRYVTRAVRGKALQEKQMNRATWPDPLGFVYSDRLTEIAQALRIQAEAHDFAATRVSGYGPAKHEGRHVFVTKEGTYAADPTAPGQYVKLPIVGVLEGVDDAISFYETTAPERVSPAMVRAGLEAWGRLMRATPGEPSIAVTNVNAIVSSPMNAVEQKYHASVVSSGLRGSGKTYLNHMLDRVQSSTLCGAPLAVPKPAINFGLRIMSGTDKGPMYRVTALRGYSPSGDDAAKAEDPPYVKTQQEQKIRDLESSNEAGGGAQGVLDRATENIGSKTQSELRGNARYTTEVPIAEPSTRERLIVTPHIAVSYHDDASPFDRDAQAALHGLEGELHHAWAAMVWHQWFDLENAEKLFQRASEATESWSVSARTKKVYAANLYSVYVLVDLVEKVFEDEEIPASLVGILDYAHDALKDCAERGASRMLGVSDLDLVRARIRYALRDRNGITFAGPPMVDEYGSEIKPYTAPSWTRDVPGAVKGETRRERVLPPGVTSVTMLGMNVELKEGSSEGAIAKADISRIVGAILRPRESTGGRPDKHGHVWWVAITTGDTNFGSLVSHINRMKSIDGDSRQFNAATLQALLMEAHTSAGTSVAVKARKRITVDTEGNVYPSNPVAVLLIDLEWLFAPLDTELVTDDPDDTEED